MTIPLPVTWSDHHRTDPKTGGWFQCAGRLVGFVMERGYTYGIVVESTMTCNEVQKKHGNRFSKVKIEELHVDPPDRPV